MIKKDVFDEFLTLPAYELLINKLERIDK